MRQSGLGGYWSLSVEVQVSWWKYYTKTHWSLVVILLNQLISMVYVFKCLHIHFWNRPFIVILVWCWYTQMTLRIYTYILNTFTAQFTAWYEDRCVLLHIRSSSYTTSKYKILRSNCLKADIFCLNMLDYYFMSLSLDSYQIHHLQGRYKHIHICMFNVICRKQHLL